MTWRTRLATLAAALSMAVAGTVTAANAGAAAAPYCGITWGSLVKNSTVTARTPNELTDIRSGRHTCYDRLVLDVDGRTSGYSVQYVATIRQDGSGQVVPVAGGARLQVVVNTAAYDDDGDATYVPTNRARVVDVTGYSTFRQVAWAGSFEGTTTLGLGVRARLPFRVFVLDGPGAGSRLVVDVAHRW